MMNKLISTLLCILIAANVFMAFVLVGAPHQTVIWIEHWFASVDDQAMPNQASANEEFKVLGPASGTINQAN